MNVIKPANILKYKLSLILVIIAFLSIACHTTKNTNKSSKSDISSSEFYKKYSKKLGVKLTGKEDKKFIEAIFGWLGTPYVYGGNSKKGTDCSGFVQTLYKDVYNIRLYRTSADLVKNCDFIDKKDLKTGDLIFFKVNSDKVSHVGIFLDNEKFVHASSSKGVIVSDLKDNYYNKYFYSGGRIKNLK
jgi:lipoprotein Spr